MALAALALVVFGAYDSYPVRCFFLRFDVTVVACTDTVSNAESVLAKIVYVSVPLGLRRGKNMPKKRSLENLQCI